MRRTSWLIRLLANSLVKIATRTPIGRAIAVAIPTMINEPTIAFATPAPSLWPTASCGVGFVKKSRLIALKPLAMTVKTISASIATASSAARLQSADHDHVHGPAATRTPVVPSEPRPEIARCGRRRHWRFRLDAANDRRGR